MIELDLFKIEVAEKEQKKPPHLSPLKVHVWQVASDRFKPEDLDYLREFLSEREKSRIERFYFERDRIRNLIAQGMLRTLLSLYTGIDPKEIAYVHGSRGKPSLKDESSQIKFNMTHSHELILYAITLEHEVGVDVEYMRSISTMEDIVKNEYSPQEQRQFHSLEGKAREAFFFRVWTRKEAYLKAIGTGITDRLNSIDALEEKEHQGLSKGLIDDRSISRPCLFAEISPEQQYAATIALIKPN